MRILILPAIAFLALAGAAQARTTLTATCKDGTSWSGTRRSSACKDHQGVQAFGDPAPAAATAASPAAAPAATPTATPAATPPATTAAAPPARPATRATPAAARTPRAQLPAAPGGGPGLVWVNSNNKVYHCQASRYYGRTKQGSYMSEAAAKTAGDRAAGGKACS